MVETLINKFKLQVSKREIGNSFVNDAKIFVWPTGAIRGETVLIMNCDIKGVVLEKMWTILILNRRYHTAREFMLVSENFLLDVEPIVLKNLINDR